MKRILLIFVCMFFVAGTLHAKDFKVVKTVKDLKVIVTMDSNPPAKGANDISITLLDQNGKALTDADVVVDYNVPFNDNTPPISFEKKTKLNGKDFTATAFLTRTGPWDFKIRIKKAGTDIGSVGYRVTVPSWWVSKAEFK